MSEDTPQMLAQRLVILLEEHDCEQCYELAKELLSDLIQRTLDGV